MAEPLRLSDLRFIAAPEPDRARGLLFFASFILGPLRIDATVRRTRDGRLVLSFPVRHDGSGRQWPIVRPVDDAARHTLEAQVLAALRCIQAEDDAP